jgi:hypothetical protein
VQVAARILSGGGEDQQPPLQREPPWIEFQRRLAEALLAAQSDQQQVQLGWHSDDLLPSFYALSSLEGKPRHRGGSALQQLPEAPLLSESLSQSPHEAGVALKPLPVVDAGFQPLALAQVLGGVAVALGAAHR